MYYNIAQRILEPTMGNNHELISTAAAQIQTNLNKQAGIGIKGIKAPLNKDRISGIVNKISAEDDFEKVKWMLDEPIINFSQSIVDDTAKANSEFHDKAGLVPKVTRTVVGGCCEWCAAKAGTYTAPNIPKDIYQRHRFCRCTIEYDPGDGKKRKISSKEQTSTEEERKKEERKKLSESGKGISNTRKECLRNEVKYNKAQKASTDRTEEEIINKLGGGDLTEGSCSSLALAYAGNKSGYIVLDFRGGASTSIFAKRSTILEIAQLPGVKSTILTEYNDFTAVNKLLKTAEEGKEYYLCAGRHAAIIRNSGKGFEYLELQSSSDNGFKSFSETTLKHRFGCPKRHTRKGKKMQVNHILIDVESLHGNEEFEKILGFINTSETSQVKGAAGSVK
ncbi:MAG: hypothetical protein ACOXZ0_03195 [Eubacteriales bacterium]